MNSLPAEKDEEVSYQLSLLSQEHVWQDQQSHAKVKLGLVTEEADDIKRRRVDPNNCYLNLSSFYIELCSLQFSCFFRDFDFSFCIIDE